LFEKLVTGGLFYLAFRSPLHFSICDFSGLVMADYKLTPSPRLENDHKHWRSRAKQMRRLAEDVAEAQARETMCVIADSYDLLAELAENRERAAAGNKN
jgi:hypothetical protein